MVSFSVYLCTAVSEHHSFNNIAKQVELIKDEKSVLGLGRERNKLLLFMQFVVIFLFLSYFIIIIIMIT